LIAIALVLPFLLWNATNGWASFQFWASYGANHSGEAGSPLDFLINQMVIMNPIALPLWGMGLRYYFSKRGARYRVFGWAYLVLFEIFILIQAKPYFLAAAYPPLFAGGAMLCDAWRQRWRQWGTRLIAYAALPRGGRSPAGPCGYAHPAASGICAGVPEERQLGGRTAVR
jgi:hypothetical protein